MFDRERSEGATEKERDGGRDRCQGEKIIAPGGGRLRLGSLFLPPSVKQPERPIRVVVNSQAGDRLQELNGYNHHE